MKKKVNILVTGCGGDIGQSVGKILQKPSFINKIVGTDIHDKHPGKFIFNKCLTVPPCQNDNYFPAIEEIVTREDIDIIIPVSEPELRLFSELGIEDNLFSCFLIKANKQALKIGFDKLETIRFLERIELPAPKTKVISQLFDPIFPLIVKNRFGAGGRDLFVADNQIDFDYLKNKYPEHIAQEIIGSESEEYTCGIFRTPSCKTREIIFKRKLTGGYSGYGEVVKNERIRKLLLTISDAIDLNGSINIQLRIRNNDPYVFEINPRFSSTILFRHLLGFKDLLWAIEERLWGKISGYSPPRTQAKFYKGFNEFVEL